MQQQFPRVLATLEPYAEIGERLRRYAHRAVFVERRRRSLRPGIAAVTCQPCYSLCPIDRTVLQTNA